MTVFAQLHVQRRKLLESFDRMAREDNVTINPNKDERVLDLCRRLFDEKRNGRQIYIDLNTDMIFNMDGFFDSIVFRENKTDRITVFVNSTDDKLHTLWKMYRQWLHDCADASAVLSHIDNSYAR